MTKKDFLEVAHAVGFISSDAERELVRNELTGYFKKFKGFDSGRFEWITEFYHRKKCGK